MHFLYIILVLLASSFATQGAPVEAKTAAITLGSRAKTPFPLPEPDFEATADATVSDWITPPLSARAKAPFPLLEANRREPGTDEEDNNNYNKDW